MVISSYQRSGGHSSVITSYCNGLSKIGYDIAIGAFFFERNPPNGIGKIKLKKFRNLASNFEENFDLIVSHQTHINYYSLITPTPFIFHYHGTASKMQEINLKFSAFLYKKRISIIVPTSNSSLHQLKKVIGEIVTSDVIHNGVDATYFNTNLPRPYSKGDPQLLFVGNLHSYKNTLKLLDVMPDILKKYPNAHLQVLGNGDEYRKLEHKIREKKLEAKVELLGALYGDDLRLRFSSCDIYISASKLEAYPLPPLEALACGKPLLLSDIPAHKELVEASNAGRTFSLKDNDSLGNLTSEVYENRKDLCMKARKFAEKYDWQAVCRRLANVYDQILVKN
jgi:glycosyltransferase involved in cell wall biosynthesis